MDARPSPTPSEDNAANTRDNSMYTAIDGAMSRHQQSYEEFLKGFSHLKKNDKALTLPENDDSGLVQGKIDLLRRINASKKKQNSEKLSNSKKLPFGCKLENKPLQAMNELVNQTTGPPDEVVNQSILTGSEGDVGELEVEELGEGELCSRLAGEPAPQTAVETKFDNFVEFGQGDSDDDVNADEDFASNYTASFCSDARTVTDGLTGTHETKKMVKTTQEFASMCSSNGLDETNKSNAVKDKDVSVDLTKPLECSMEMPKDVSVPNGEDNIKQLESGTNVKVNSGDSCSGTATDELLMNFMADLQAELLGESKDKCTENTNLEQSETSVVNKDDDLPSLGVDNDLNDKVTYDMESTEVETDFKSEINKMAGMTNIADNDSDDGTRDGTEDNIGANSEEAPQGDLLFPGEVEDKLNKEEVPHERLLDFAVTYRSNSPIPSDGNTEECSNEVQPFSLDNEFDYDNVVLTPKFSEDEMNRIQQIVKMEQVSI